MCRVYGKRNSSTWRNRLKNSNFKSFEEINPPHICPFQYCFVIMYYKPIRKTSIKDYKIIETISFGLRTSVYKARKKENEKLFAIKEFKREDINSSPQTLKLFNLEMKINKAIADQRLIGFVEAIKTKSSFYLIMEYFKYESVESLISKQEDRRLPRQFCTSIIYSLVDIFKYLRKFKIFHRALDLDALYFDPINNKLKIGLLGLLKQNFIRIDKMQYARMPYHLIIDSKKNLKEFGQNLDLFLLGIVYYRLLSGKEPFSGKDRKSLIEDIQNKLNDKKGGYLDVLGDEYEEEREIIRGLIQIDPKKQKGIDFILSSRLFKEHAKTIKAPVLNDANEKGKARKDYLNGDSLQQQQAQQQQLPQQGGLINLRSNNGLEWSSITTINQFNQQVGKELDAIQVYYNNIQDQLIITKSKRAIDLCQLSLNLFLKKIDLVRTYLDHKFISDNSVELDIEQLKVKRAIRDLIEGIIEKNPFYKKHTKGYFLDDHNIKRMSVLEKALELVMDELARCFDKHLM